ncbi:DMT family transporter, partial [Brevibacillus laterosporus]|uniref:DMT family transporter n=2 Tax=Bacillales TaxID=1385 RepID=UPI00215C5004
MLFLFVLGIIAGMMVPIQTSINSRLGRFTESSFYASTISFFVGTLFLLILNIIFNIQMFSSSFYAGHSIDYHWWVGGLLGVCFLTGNLLLLPRLGAALTVVMTVAGQIIMGVIIDTLGLLGANQTSFTFLKGVGIIVLLFGILLM